MKQKEVEGRRWVAADPQQLTNGDNVQSRLSLSIDEIDRRLSDEQFSLIDNLDNNQRLLEVVLKARRSRSVQQMALALSLCEMRGRRAFGGEL